MEQAAWLRPLFHKTSMHMMDFPIFQLWFNLFYGAQEGNNNCRQQESYKCWLLHPQASMWQHTMRRQSNTAVNSFPLEPCLGCVYCKLEVGETAIIKNLKSRFTLRGIGLIQYIFESLQLGGCSVLNLNYYHFCWYLNDWSTYSVYNGPTLQKLHSKEICGKT